MHRLIVALLATVDAALSVAVGIAATLAPLTLLWVIGFGGTADWSTLWPAAVAVWQLGNLTPLALTLPAEYLAVTGIDPAAASFTLSLAPLAFAGFTAVFAARSGVRASRADAWITGVVTATVVFAALAAGAALTSANAIARVELWHAIVVPTAVFAVPAVVAGVVTEWREGVDGPVARVRDRIEASAGDWGAVPSLVARGAAVVVVGLLGLGALVTAVALFARAGQIVALFQAGNVDALGATVLTLAQLVYLPTLVVWGLSFAAGPGFAVGEGTAVSPAGTQVGVIPGLPVLGAVPESTTSWLFLLALVPIALGALAGWIARSRLVRAHDDEWMSNPAAAMSSTPASFDAARTSALEGLLSTAAVSRPQVEPEADTPGWPREAEHPVGPRLATAVGIAVAAAIAVAVLAAAASGSLGPGRLAVFGPDPGPLALAVGLEAFVGAAILLLSPRGHGRQRSASTDTARSASRSSTRQEEIVPFAGESAADPPTKPRFSESWRADAGGAARNGRVAGETDASSTRRPDLAVPPSEARTEPIDLPRLD